MPVTARLAGRLGVARTLATASVVNATGTLALAFVGSSAGLLVGLGLLTGASMPPLMPVVRALYPRMVPGDEVRTLFALDTTAQELIWVVGPVAATVLASAIATTFPLLLCAAVVLLGTAWFLLGSRRLHPARAVNDTRFGRILFHRAVLLAGVANLALVASFTALEVGIIAALGSNGLVAGAAIASASVGSLIGDFCSTPSARTQRRRRSAGSGWPGCRSLRGPRQPRAAVRRTAACPAWVSRPPCRSCT